MKISLFLVSPLLLLASSYADAQPVLQTPTEQALSNKLLQEISNGLQCQSTLITTQRELEELKKSVHKDDKPPPAASPNK